MSRISKTFVISKAIALVMDLLLSASLILFIMTVKTPTVNLKQRNPYCLSHLRLFLVEVIGNLLVDDSLKKLLTLRRLMG